MTGYRYLLREKIIEKINKELEEIPMEERKIVGAYWSPADVVKRPAVVVLPEELESNFSNTLGGRDRVYPYRMFVSQLLQNRKQTEVEKELSEIEDYLVNMFDKRGVLGDVEGLILVEPTPSVWGWITAERGWERVATVTITCKIKISTT